MPVMVDGSDPDTWRPGPCPRCGKEQVHDGRWLDVTSFSDVDPVVMPCHVWCPDPKCRPVPPPVDVSWVTMPEVPEPIVWPWWLAVPAAALRRWLP